jgi:hypothetical protein
MTIQQFKTKLIANPSEINFAETPEVFKIKLLHLNQLN